MTSLVMTSLIKVLCCRWDSDIKRRSSYYVIKASQRQTSSRSHWLVGCFSRSVWRHQSLTFIETSRHQTSPPTSSTAKKSSGKSSSNKSAVTSSVTSSQSRRYNNHSSSDHDVISTTSSKKKTASRRSTSQSSTSSDLHTSPIVRHQWHHTFVVTWRHICSKTAEVANQIHLKIPNKTKRSSRVTMETVTKRRDVSKTRRCRMLWHH